MKRKITPRRVVTAILNRAARKLTLLSRQINDPTLRTLRRRGMPIDCYDALSKKWLRDMNFRTVLDVGANVGQFAAGAHAILPDAAIYSFEPLPDCYAQLVKTMAGVGKFRAFNVGLGAARAEMQINRSPWSASSSFRKMAKLHIENYPRTEGHETATVPVETLDGIMGPMELAEPILLKMDVQGYEDQVLAGGKGIASRAAVIIVEVSFETLYEGQPLFDDIYRAITGMGLVYKGNLEQAPDQNGRLLYADAIFLRSTTGDLS